MKLRDLIFTRNPSATALLTDDGNVTFGDLALKANAVRRALTAVRGQNIALFLPNGKDFIAATFAVIASGLTVFPLSVSLTAYEIAPLLAQAEVRYVVTTKAYAHVFAAFAVRLILTDELPACGETLPVADVSENDTMILLGTSGTTGNLKIVKLSEKNIAVCVQSYIDKMDYEKCADGVRYILGTPYACAYGLLVIFVCAARSFPLILLRDSFTLDGLYKTAAKHRATHYEGGAAVAFLMAQTAGRRIPYDISSLKYFGFGGSKVSAQMFRDLLAAYPHAEFWPGYGMTEAAPLIAKPDKFTPEAKLGAVGTAMDGETILIETADGLTNAPYVRGEIVVSGDNVTSGYYGNDGETRKILKDGRLHTGDVGYLDEDGWLYICGRKKNVIIVRGFNVYAEEVEACVLDSKLAKDCRVYGETDGRGVETVCADIVPARCEVTADDVRSYCAARLAPYKVPRKIRVTDNIGKTATGKNKMRKE